MGLSYRFEVICESSKVDALLEDLRQAVSKKGSEELKAVLPFKEVSSVNTNYGRIKFGLAGMPLARCGHSVNKYCFSLPKPDIIDSEEYFEDYIGCIWTSLYVGEDWTALEMTAATSAISRELEKPEFKKKMIKNFPNAHMILFDDERENLKLIHPIQRSITLPEGKKFEIEELNFCKNINWLGKVLNSYVSQRTKYQ